MYILLLKVTSFIQHNPAKGTYIKALHALNSADDQNVNWVGGKGLKPLGNLRR